MAQAASKTMHAPEIAPFWSRIPSFFSYPLHPGPLLACLLVAGCAYLITLIDEPWVAAAAGLVTLILVLRYVFRIMEQTSRGFLTPSEHLPIHSPERANLPYKLFAVLLIWGAVTGLLAFALFGQQPPFLPVRLLPVFQFVVNALVAFCLPAIVMNLSMSNSFVQTVSPLSWIGIQASIGRPYYALCTFLFLLNSSGPIILQTVVRMFQGGGHGWLVPAAGFVGTWFAIVMFNMMGYCLYQYHHMLGHTIASQRGAGPAQHPADRSAEEIAERITAGDLPGALRIARDVQRTLRDDLPSQERYFKLLQFDDKPLDTLAHARRLIGLALRKGRGDKALEVYQRARTIDARFALESAADCRDLAIAARKARQFTMALEVLRDVEPLDAMGNLIPEALLLSARILSDDLKEDEAARDLLHTLIERFPNEPVTSAAREYLKIVDTMTGIAMRPGQTD